MIKSTSAFHHLQVNLFAELVEQLLEEGKLSLSDPEEFHRKYPGRPKSTVVKLAGLQGLKRFLQN